MRLHAEQRLWLEHALRAMVILALALMLWRSSGERTGVESRTIDRRGLDVGALTEWSTMASARAIHVELARMPTAVDRAWLAALAAAQSNVTWRGELPPLMIAVQPVSSPVGGANVLIAAPSGSSVAVEDGGASDTVSANNAGMRLTLASRGNHVTAGVKASFASTARRDSVLLRKLLVIGTAGWESKFVVAALEEEGWHIDTRIRAAPDVDITQGAMAMLDTSRYAAVIALDGAATPYASRMTEFARTGGGVVLASRAASPEAFSGLRAGVNGRGSAGSLPASAAGSVSLESLSSAPIVSLKSDAVAVERRSGAVTVAARRIGAGRALQIGYENTWRWRMGGGTTGVDEHRQWWTAMVSSVAHAPRISHAIVPFITDEAPMAGLVDAVGRASARPAATIVTGRRLLWTISLFALLVIGLVGEVISRRLRGVA
jgi:hypothetical protein